MTVSMKAVTRNDICSETITGTGVFGNKKSRALESQVVTKSIMEHALLED